MLFARVNKTDRRFSHAGMMISPTEVVHVEQDADGGVRAQTIDAFRAQSVDFMVLRPPPTFDAAAATALLQNHLDHHTAFDDLFSLGDHSKVYCTELVWLALAAGGLNVADLSVVNGRAAVLPEDFLHRWGLSPI